MISLDSHPGIPRERMEQVGGKASTIEAIARAAPVAPIPKFRIEEEGGEDYRSLRVDNIIVRGSSVLDFLGGFGVSATLVSVKRVPDAIREVKKSADSDLGRELAKLRGFAQVPPVTAIVQQQIDAAFYGVMMAHPIDRERFLVDLSDARSMYSHEQKLATSTLGIELPSGVDRFLSGIGAHGFSINSWNRSSAQLRISRDADVEVVGGSDGLMENPPVKFSIDLAVLWHEEIEKLGIFNPEAVYVMEYGIMDDGSIHLFQYTPVMRKGEVNDTEIPDNYHQIGHGFIGSTTGKDGLTLPVVRIPRMSEMETYLRGEQSQIDKPSRLAEMLDEKKMQGLGYFLTTEREHAAKLLKSLARSYIIQERNRVGGGKYALAVGGLDRVFQDIIFSIPAPEVAIIEVAPLGGLLQHGMSRIFYEVPHVFVGGDIPDGEKVNFRSNGQEAGALAVN